MIVYVIAEDGEGVKSQYSSEYLFVFNIFCRRVAISEGAGNGVQVFIEVEPAALCPRASLGFLAHLPGDAPQRARPRRARPRRATGQPPQAALNACSKMMTQPEP